MKKLLVVCCALIAISSPARADYAYKDGNGVLQTIISGTVSGKILPYSVPADGNASPLGVSGNPFHMVCDSGNCTATSPFGQAIGASGTLTGFKDASGIFQPSLGDVTAGQWVNIKASIPLTLTGLLPAFASPPTVNIGSSSTFPLPTGAATASFQVTGNTSLSSIDGKTPALGQALSAASTPVVLPATQVAALTPPTTVFVQSSQLTASSPSGSSTLTSAGVAQNIFAASEAVHGCGIQNPRTSAESIWVSFVTTAQASYGNTSIEVTSGSSISCPSGLTNAVSWNAASSGHVISAYRW